MINKVILVGRLGSDPEIRNTQAGDSVAELSVATSFGSGDKEKTEWHRVVLWGKLAETAGKYLVKGRQVYIEGRIQSRSYDDKEGNKRYITEVVAQEVKFLGSKTTESPAADGGELPF